MHVVYYVDRTPIIVLCLGIQCFFWFKCHDNTLLMPLKIANVCKTKYIMPFIEFWSITCLTKFPTKIWYNTVNYLVKSINSPFLERYSHQASFFNCSGMPLTTSAFLILEDKQFKSWRYIDQDKFSFPCEMHGLSNSFSQTWLQ